MAKVIIFGIQDFASLAHYYLKTDSAHEVVGFTVNEQYIPSEKTFEGKPVFPFETIEKKISPDEYMLFAPMSPKKMNKLREQVYNEIKSKGYQMISYVSSKATCFNGAIGDNCFILENNTIQPFTKIGNNVVLWSGNHIGHHSIIKDHVLFTSHVVLSGHCVVEENSFFGVNSTVRDGITIRKGSLIAMSASIFKDTEEWGVYKGNPAVKGEKLSHELNM
jgi:sugar O-acyltransferase (sialic acid O-acetyltransferase NeuD family)